MVHQVGAYPPGRYASPSQGSLPAVHSPVPIYTPGEDRHCKSNVSCPRTQRGAPARARIRTVRSRV